MDQIRIRTATLGDLEDLLPLVHAYRVFYQRTPEPAAERRYLSARLGKGDSTLFVARVNAKAVGFAQLFTTQSTVCLGPSLLIEDLFVDPAARGRGIARALLERAKEYADEKGATVMFLETANDNFAAQRVYERAGWLLETDFRKYNCPLQRGGAR